MRIILFLFATAMLAGCSTSPPGANPSAVPGERQLAFRQKLPGSAEIIVTRDEGWMAGGGCYVAVFIDGQLSARVDVGERAVFYVKAGRRHIGMSGDPSGKGLCAMQVGQPLKETSTRLEAGEVQRFRISGDTNGLDIRPSSI
ncbi:MULTISPECIES: lipoprotein [Pseudomonadaceae]|uniref:lipoprotein n=1 Tax=Pseudomonadaceae TaxID=135621 RepID=UPI0009F60899|nr:MULTISPECIES: lipoprotein [Pseudomonas]